jgi:CDP-diacylglycerol---serine O-phosphatidyltransferase
MNEAEPRRRRRGIAVLPTMFTLGNLVSGFFAIVIASRVVRPEGPGFVEEDVIECMKAGWLIFLAMVFDALDGYVARLSKSASGFGAQLDSLADLVTFGVAPAILLVKISPAVTYQHREAIWVIAATFAVCAALRLARFNVETDETDDHMHFSGLPSPAAAASIASIAILFKTLTKEENPFAYAEQFASGLQFVLPFYALGVALLMVSRVPYPHLVNQLFRGRRSFNHIVSVVFALVAVMIVRSYSVPLICFAFVLSGPVRYLWREVILPLRRPSS